MYAKTNLKYSKQKIRYQSFYMKFSAKSTGSCHLWFCTLRVQSNRSIEIKLAVKVLLVLLCIRLHELISNRKLLQLFAIFHKFQIWNLFPMCAGYLIQFCLAQHLINSKITYCVMKIKALKIKHNNVTWN